MLDPGRRGPCPSWRSENPGALINSDGKIGWKQSIGSEQKNKDT